MAMHAHNNEAENPLGRDQWEKGLEEIFGGNNTPEELDRIAIEAQEAGRRDLPHYEGLPPPIFAHPGLLAPAGASARAQDKASARARDAEKAAAARN